MKNKINANKFLEVSKINDVLTLSYDLDNIIQNSTEVLGEIKIECKYFRTDNVEESIVSKTIEFNIMLHKDMYIVKDINIINFDYEIIVNSGLEIIYTLEVEYEEAITNNRSNTNNDDIDVSDQLNNDSPKIIEALEKSEEHIIDIENISKIDDKEVDFENSNIEKLINIKSDNVVKNIIKDSNTRNKLDFTENLKDTKSSLRVYYNVDESNIEKIANDNNISIDKIYSTNKYNINSRIIISE